MKPVFSWLDAERRDALTREYHGPMPRGRDALVYREPPPYLDKPTVDGRPHLLFVAYYPYATVIKRAIALRQAADVRLTFVGCCIREDADIGRWFDAAYEVADYAELFAMLRQARPWASHVTMPPGLLAALAVAAREQGGLSRLLIDLVDCALFREGDADHPASRLERAVLSHCDGLVHKLPPQGLDRLLTTYGLDLPAEQVHSLPWRPLFEQAEVPPRAPWRLVYCGGVMPRRIALARGYGHHILDPLVHGTRGIGAEVAVYVNQNARDMHWEDQQGYWDMAREEPHFSFRKGLPFDRLPAAVADAHAGLIFDNLPLTAHNQAIFRYNMSSKVFSYLEAGLPVLVYKEMDYIRREVEAHGLGLVYPLDDLAALPRLLAGADYPALRANVRRYRERFELATTIPALLQAFGLEARP